MQWYLHTSTSLNFQSTPPEQQCRTHIPLEYRQVTEIIAGPTLPLASSPQHEKCVSHFQQQSDVCICFRSELPLYRDLSKLLNRILSSERWRLSADHVWHLALRLVEGPQISDVRGATQQQNGDFEPHVNKAYLCWKKKPRRWVNMHGVSFCSCYC